MTQESINQLWAFANANDAMAMAYIGVIVYEGRGVKQDTQQGLAWLRKATNANVLYAKDLLQYIIHVTDENTNISQNFLLSTNAVQQLELCVQQNSTYAMVFLAEILYMGTAFVQDKARAIEYLTRASQLGCILAKEILTDYQSRESSLSNNSSSPFDVFKKQNREFFLSKGRNENFRVGSNAKEHSSEQSHKEDHMKELNEMIGLSRVKEEVASLRNFVLVQEQRKRQGLKSNNVSYHCVFSGNPGTGKKTVARIVAGIYKDLGILKKGHLVEVQRSDLVAEYVGQTATKTNAKIDEALDGVLFIDEAYTLAEGGQGDFGQEAINTLLKRMEDDRNRLVVILAGYSKEIQHFIDSNPGLQSRFNRYIHFDDYSYEELLRIFIFNLSKNDFKITRDAFNAVGSIIREQIANKDSKFGNARYIRNMFETVIMKQANRLASSKRNPSKEELMLITIEDIAL